MITTNRKRQKRNSLAWRIQFDQHEGILVGTIHQAYPGYEPLVQAMVTLFQSQVYSRYFGETNLEELADFNFQVPSVQDPLSTHISSKRVLKFRAQLMQFTKLDLLALDRMPPMMISSLIASRLVQYPAPSIDQILWNCAREAEVPVSGLESFEEQLDIFHQIPYDYQVQQLKKMLGNLSQARLGILTLTDLYQKQLIHKLHKQGKKSLGALRQLMLAKRNHEMAQRIRRHILEQLNPTFFSFGAAHLAGEFGILHILSKAGGKLSPIQLV